MALLLPAFLLAAALLPASPSPRPEMPVTHLESRRLGARAVYLGTVSAVRRLGGLEGLTGENQGRLEAAIGAVKALRAPAGIAASSEVRLPFDSRAPEAEGDGF